MGMKEKNLQKKDRKNTKKQHRQIRSVLYGSIVGTFCVMAASLGFYFCPDLPGRVLKAARFGISFAQTASAESLHKFGTFLKEQTQPKPEPAPQMELALEPVPASADPVVTGKAEDLDTEANDGSYDAVILDTCLGPMQYYNQGDVRWSSYPYGGSDPMIQYGCGPTAASMLIASFTDGNDEVTPVTIADWSAAHGFYAPQGGSYHSLIPSVLAAYGLQAEPVRDRSVENAASLLSSGHILVALMGKGSLTQNGHFILITRLLPDGNVSIADPNSLENSTHEWELPLLMGELKKVYDSGAPLWAVSIAASNSSLS